MNRNHLFYMLLSAILFTSSASAQFKQPRTAEPTVSSSMIRPASAGEWFGLFNPDNLMMRQSYSMSYSSFAGQGLAIGRYTNSMNYRFSEKLDARVDVSLQHSPYSTLDQKISSSLTGIFVDRAELRYRPAENISLQVSYRQLPYGYYGMHSPWSVFSPFNDRYGDDD